MSTDITGAPVAAREIIVDAFFELLDTAPDLTGHVYLYGDDDSDGLEVTHAIVGADNTAVTQASNADRSLEENATRILVELHHFETTGQNWTKVLTDLAGRIRNQAVRLERKLKLQRLDFEGDKGIEPYGADSRGVFASTQLRFIATYYTERGACDVIVSGNY